MDFSEKKERLSRSVEVRHIRNNVIIFVVITVALLAVSLLTEDAEQWRLRRNIWLVLMLAVFVSYGIWYWKIMRRFEDYIFCTAKLVDVRNGFVKHTRYFVVAVDVPGWGKIEKRTHSVFQTQGIPGPMLKDYQNMDATLAYNPTTGQLVVIE